VCALQAAGGAVAGAGAAFNAVAGNLLGLVVTPALVLLALPGAIPGEVQLTKQLMKLGSQVHALNTNDISLLFVVFRCVTMTTCVHKATCQQCVDRYIGLQQQHRAMLSSVRFTCSCCIWTMRHCTTAATAAVQQWCHVYASSSSDFLLRWCLLCSLYTLLLLLLLLLPLLLPLLPLPLQVVAPLAAGSLLRLSPAARNWQKRYKRILSRFSEVQAHEQQLILTIHQLACACSPLSASVLTVNSFLRHKMLVCESHIGLLRQHYCCCCCWHLMKLCIHACALYLICMSIHQQAVLLSIVYNVFCDALVPGVGGTQGALQGVLSPRDALILPAALVALQVCVSVTMLILSLMLNKLQSLCTQLHEQHWLRHTSAADVLVAVVAVLTLARTGLEAS
jgi:hypothetical protein